MLFNEPKLLKFRERRLIRNPRPSFSALQRAEIAEIDVEIWQTDAGICFSALQRAEIAEILQHAYEALHSVRFSALQRAEIAEMLRQRDARTTSLSFSALQRAEIAEMPLLVSLGQIARKFQCSSTSRNC